MKTNPDPEALGRLLRLTAPPARLIPDAAYNAQILAAIRTETALRARPAHAPLPPLAAVLARLRDAAVLCAACGLTAAAVLFTIRSLRPPPAPQIVAIRVADDRVAASAVGSEDGMPVLWVTGFRPVGGGEPRPAPSTRVN